MQKKIKNEISSIKTDIENHFNYENTELLNIKYDNNLKNILIIGFYGAPNLGDELMLETVLDYLELIPNKKITVLLANNPEYSIDKYKDVRFLHYPKNLYDFNIMAEQFDYYIFGGGAIIDDKHYNEEKSYQYDLGTILIKLSIRAIAFNKKIMCMALSSSNSIENVEYIEKLKYIIQNSCFFSVRDEFTKKYLSEILGNEYGNRIKKVHDIVFSNKELLSYLTQNRKKNKILNIGIVATCNDNNKEKINIILNGIKKMDSNIQINLIPFYDYKHIDIKSYSNITDNNNDIKIQIEQYPENMKQLIEVYKKNDIIIGMRYHSILLAYSLNIPCISICYDIHEHYPHKIEYLNNLFDKDEALSYSNLSEDEIYQNLSKLIEHFDENKNYKIAKTILTEAKEQINSIIKATFEG